MSRHRRHWYRMYIGECHVCGRDKSYRERVYGRRPRSPRRRYRMIPQVDTYDWCNAL